MDPLTFMALRAVSDAQRSRAKLERDILYIQALASAMPQSSSVVTPSSSLPFLRAGTSHLTATSERSVSPQLINTVLPALNQKRSLLNAIDTSNNEVRESKRPRLVTSASSDSRSSASPVLMPQHQQQRRSSKTMTKRDDFWSKVGKLNSHIHLVNVVLGRLLNDHIKTATNGNRVLSNDVIKKILDTQLYGKYKCEDFFVSSVKGSETVRNTWTRLNFSSDNRSSLSKYKAQTWEAIERCSFEDVSSEDKAEMAQAIQKFEKTGKFVHALEVALKGIITEEFVAILMKLRKEWNVTCAAARPEMQDAAVAKFLSRHGLNGK